MTQFDLGYLLGSLVTGILILSAWIIETLDETK